MKLDFYRDIVSTIESNKQLQGYGFDLEFFRVFESKWYRHDNKAVESNSDILSVLTAVNKTKQSKKDKSCQYLNIEVLDAVLKVQFPKHTKSATITEFVHSLHEVLDFAEATYFSTHDPLTRLLNRAGSEKVIKKILASVEQGHSTVETHAPLTNQYVGLIAFDIDHFKQVNDSYGHGYGDAVLKSFAWRLEDEILKLNKEGLKYDFVFSRPGGEEFEIFVSNLDSSKSLSSLAERFRSCISTEHLPNDKQFSVVLKDISLNEDDCPKAQSRTVYTSVGYSYGGLGGAKKGLYSNLKAEADAALYRAKSDGRNCSRNFFDIVKVHGKIIDHLTVDNIVIIDIGRNVNVGVDDVFKVFSPEFSGEKPYTISDSRTTKVLGNHPKIPLAKIQVIDVQTSISFCAIVENRSGDSLVTGSYLEYQAMGLDRPYFNNFPPATVNNLLRPNDFVMEVGKNHEEGQLACLGIAYISTEVIEEDNDTYLDLLLSILTISLPTGYQLGYLKKGVIGFFTNTDNHSKPLEIDMLEKVCNFKDIRFSISIGVLLPKLLVKEKGQETEPMILQNIASLFESSQKLAVMDLFHLTRLCGYLARHVKDTRLTVYSEREVVSFLSNIRNINDLNDSIYEYHRLVSMGFNSHDIHLQGALIILTSQNDELLPIAEIVLERSLNITSSEYYHIQNLAIIKVKLGKYLEAYELFKPSATHLLKNETNSIYLTHYAKSAIEVTNLRLKKIAPKRMKNILSRAIKFYRRSDYINPEWISEIKSKNKEL